MARTLLWKAKVAHSICAVLLIVLSGFHAKSQIAHTIKVTYSCKAVRLEKVIEHISEVTGLYFVYSSDKISLSTPVTLSVKDKPVDDVLSIIGSQINLSFKIHERHVAVKIVDAPIATAIARKIEIPKNVVEQIDADKPTEVELLANRNPQFFSVQENKDRYLVQLHPSFNSNVVNRIPRQYLSSKQYLKSNWFVVAGALVNDYSMGFEVQAGLRQAYLVFTPSWLRTDNYHGGLGIGSSFRLNDKFSVNPMYVYASLTQKQAYNNTFGGGPSYTVNSDIIHHQLKLMLQYSLTEKLNLRAGVIYNITSSINHYQYFHTSEQGQYTYGVPQSTYYQEPPRYSGLGPSHQTISQPTETVGANHWLGWEVSFSYKINFLRKP